MNECKKIMPERLYPLDPNMSLEKILQAKELGTPLVGKAILWNSQANCLEINLGNNFYGFIPEDRVSVYPVFAPDDPQKLSASIRSLIGNPVLVNVVEVDDSDGSMAITLSRKENMLHAFDAITNLVGKSIECCVTSIKNFGIYVDVGNGINGLIHHSELSLSRFNHFSEMGIRVGDKIIVKVLSVNNNFHVALNYRDQFKNLTFTLNPGDLIEAIVLESVNQEGNFAYLNPNTPAIVDIPPRVHCYYGEKIVARVKGPSKKRPDSIKLSFVSFVNDCGL